MRSKPILKFRTLVLLVILQSGSREAFGQFYAMPTEHSFNILTERQLATGDSIVQPFLQPYIPFFSTRFANVQDSHVVFRYIKDDPAIDFIFKRHFLQVRPKDEDFTLNIDPILNLELGSDLADPAGGRIYTNTRGVVASGTIGRKFYFETSFAENQSLFPSYLRQQAELSQVVPGQGRWKRFKTSGYDYAFATGLASIQVSKNLNVQFGHGKHKVGQGYRSLLLSDNAFNYPFARITQQWFRGKVRYTNIYAVLMNLEPAAAVTTRNTERLFQKKLAAFQTAEIQLFRWLHTSLFQGIVWQAGDSRNRQTIDWWYVNPLIYSHLVAKGLHDPRQNVVAGADLLVKITGKFNVYGQFMADHRSDGIGYQAGFRWFDALRLRGLTLQAEYNNTGANSFFGITGSPYTHHNQNLSYSLINGTEAMVMADFRKSRFFMNARYHRQTLLYGSRNGCQITSVRAGYIINPRYNLNVSAGYTGRRNFYNFASADSDTDYLFISVRTSIYNLYYDF